MPSVTYNGQSFAIDGRRMWLLGASIQYARVPHQLWPQRIAAARQAGFNTIETACPWLVHEPRRGRFVFDGDVNLRQFIQACGAAGMRVILRAGPYIGSQFDGGGLPGWLIETPGIVLRQNNEIFLEHVSRYFRRLLSEVSDLQATTGGPILMVQSEHAWTCSNDQQAEKYLNEVTRFIRESGMNVPIINANDLWQESAGTIDTWRGYDDLLVHLRQLRTVQMNAPRLVSAFEAAGFETWGAGRGNVNKTADAVLRHLAEILAGGAQPVVSPFHAGTNFGFLGGRVSGGPNAFVTTSAAVDAPLGEAGTRGDKYHAIRRLITFANHFGHVFAELDPDYQPIVFDPATIERDRASRGSDGAISVVPLRGPQGRIVFVFPGPNQPPTTTLVLDDGLRLHVDLGDQTVGWFVFDVDLYGLGRLDFCSISPWAIVDRSIVVFQGPARASSYLSISGSPLEVSVPAEGAAPLVLDHKGLTIVICNQAQIDATYHDEHAVYVGIGGFDGSGAPLPNEGFPKPWVIRKNAQVKPLEFSAHDEPGRGARGKAISPRPSASAKLQLPSGFAWQAAPCAEYISGQSPRFASLEGPETLSECGAPSGYGWYRVNLEAAGRKLCHLPRAADRLHVFIDGAFERLFGVGPGADADPFELKLTRGQQALVALVDNLGRFADGNDLGHRKGLFGHIYEVKAMRSVKPKLAVAEPVDPFSLRGFIAGRAAGQMSDSRQAIWTFAHTRKNPILIDVKGAAPSGVFVLNDQPVAYYAGATGACMDQILLEPETNESFKRGKNVLRFAPDLRRDGAAEDVASSTTLYECLETLSESARWAFAKWEPPAASAYSPVGRGDFKNFKRLPCWWRATFEMGGEPVEGRKPQVESRQSKAESRKPKAESPQPPTVAPMAHSDFSVWLDTAGLSKGQVFINGQNLGRYFTATATGKAVGPQTRLYVPWPWLKPGQTNEIVIFDEHGFEPGRVKVVKGE